MSEGKSGPSISAVIPAYNSEKFVGDAIQSALDQTYEIAEVIVVDDGSSDGTAEAAARYPRTRVIRRPNGGQGAARNTGIQAATSEWVAFLDHDDLWKPNKTEIQVGMVTPQVGVVYSDRWNSISFGELWHRQVSFGPSGTMVRRSVLLEVGGFDESRAVMGVEDVNLWMKIALTGWQFARTEFGLFEWRTMAGNQSRNEPKMARAELASIDVVAGLSGCPPVDVNRIKQASRIEYAKNLIANEQWADATQILADCAPGRATRLLSLACFLKMKRMARTSVVSWLQGKDAQYASHGCTGGCRLSGVTKANCMESSRLPFQRYPM